MAEVVFKGETEVENDYLRQGDVVYCEAHTGGAHNFWGIYITTNGGSVIAFNGGGSSMVTGRDLYVGQQVSYWTIKKRIPCDKAKITIEEV